MSRLLLIARREYLSYLKTPGFWMSLLVAPLVMGFALMGGPRLLESTAPAPILSVVDLTHSGFEASLAAAVAGPPPLADIAPPPEAAARARTPEAAAAALHQVLSQKDGLDIAVVISGTATQARADIWTRDASPNALRGVIQGAVAGRMRQNRLTAAGLSPDLLKSMEAVQPEVRAYSPRAQSGQVSLRDQAPGMLGLGMAFVLWMVVVTGAGILLNSVIEEKSGRILEVLMSCASIPQILGGKILGVAALAGTVLLVWAGLGLAGMAHSSPRMVGEMGRALIGHGLGIWFMLFFVGGYLMYASMFAAIGAFCETTREAQTLLGPLMMLLSVPMLFLSVAQQHPNAPVVAILSWVPPFTPFLMLGRIAGGLPLWQAAMGLVEMAATGGVIVWLCARAFQAGALSGGGKVNLRRVFAGMAKPVA